MADGEGNTESPRSHWSPLGIGGALSLCCLVAAPAASGAVGGGAGGGVVGAFGGSLVQILVTALNVGLLAAILGSWNRGAVGEG